MVAVPRSSRDAPGGMVFHVLNRGIGRAWGRTRRDDPAFPLLATCPSPRASDWLEIVNRPQSEEELQTLRCCVHRGCPFGDTDWIAATARRLGLDSTLRQRGRPRREE